MRVLRSSCWSRPDRPPIMGVVLDGDTSDTLESELLKLTEGVPEALILSEIFEMPDGTDIEAATWEATRRTNGTVAQGEKHQVFLYFWLVRLWSGGDPQTEGKPANSGALMAGDQPMPLSVDEIKVVFAQLAQHPGYDDFILSYLAKDGTPVTMRHGEIE